MHKTGGEIKKKKILAELPEKASFSYSRDNKQQWWQMEEIHDDL